MKERHIIIPRILIPRGEETKTWAAPASLCRETMERAASVPAALRFLLPENGEDGEDEAARIEAARSYMYDALENTLEKLNRGAMLIEHKRGKAVRYGIIAALDLEAYTMSEGEASPVRPAQKFSMARAGALSRLRENSVLEFSSAAVFYRDKKNKIVHALGENLEEVYAFETGGERIRGMFIPADAAWEVADDMHTHGTPCFAVAAGGEEVAGAKLHWERVKKGLAPEEAEMHPARYFLAEFVNVYDPGLTLSPVCRILSDVEPEALFGFLSRRLKCAREGNCIRISGRDAAACIRETDDALGEYLKKNGGSVRYAAQFRADDEAVILLPAPEAEDVFSYLKGGRLLNEHSFALEGCYHFEGREISYD